MEYKIFSVYVIYLFTTLNYNFSFCLLHLPTSSEEDDIEYLEMIKITRETLITLSI